MPNRCVAPRCRRYVWRAGLRCRRHGGRAPGRTGAGVASHSGWLCAAGCGARVKMRGGKCSRRRCGGLRRGRPGKKFLEVFAGCARLSAAARAGGMRVLPPVDTNTGWRLPRGLHRLRRLVDEANWVHFAPPCTVWSAARASVPAARRAADQDAARPLLDLTAQMARRLAARGAFFTVEHPNHSMAWGQEPLRGLAEQAGVHKVVLHQCRFGLRVRGELRQKATKLLSNLALHGMARICNHTGGHPHLTGSGCKLAEAYPRPLCTALVKAVRANAAK